MCDCQYCRGCAAVAVLAARTRYVGPQASCGVHRNVNPGRGRSRPDCTLNTCSHICLQRLIDASHYAADIGPFFWLYAPILRACLCPETYKYFVLVRRFIILNVSHILCASVLSFTALVHGEDCILVHSISTRILRATSHAGSVDCS